MRYPMDKIAVAKELIKVAKSITAISEYEDVLQDVNVLQLLVKRLAQQYHDSRDKLANQEAIKITERILVGLKVLTPRY
jgi:hypothetical protein